MIFPLLEEGPIRRIFKQVLSRREKREKFEDALETVWKPELEKCKLIEDFDERLACKSEILHGISVAQDLVNLNVHGDFFSSDPQCSKDSRWEVVNMLDNANAVFLGVSNAEYDPERFVERGHYVEEKADSFCRRWRRILWNSQDTSENKLKKRTEEEKVKSRQDMKNR